MLCLFSKDEVEGSSVCWDSSGPSAQPRRLYPAQPRQQHQYLPFIILMIVLNNMFLQLYVFGGKNEEQDFNDLKVMKLINPSERQPGK